MLASSDFLRERHRSLTVVILPSSSKRAGSVIDGQLSPVWKLKNACKREGELPRVYKDYARLSTAAISRFLMFVSVADCAKIIRGWTQQARHSFKTHMALFCSRELSDKLRRYRPLISILIRRGCSFTNLLNPSRMQAVEGVNGASRSIVRALNLAGGDEIDASRFSSGSTMRGRALRGFLPFKHLSKVIVLLSNSRLVTCTWIYCVTSVTFASHGPAQ